jgi:glycosyltransferase involved in cell wall biosynthesis
MKYTVIVPFYDTIDYINESLDSILRQNSFDINNIQILIINDGSSNDLQPNIDKYKALGLNIKYYSKPNGN